MIETLFCFAKIIIIIIFLELGDTLLFLFSSQLQTEAFEDHFKNNLSASSKSHSHYILYYDTEKTKSDIVILYSVRLKIYWKRRLIIFWKSLSIP